MATDPKTFGEQYAEAIRAWAAAHPSVRLEDIAAVLDTAADAETVRQFLADPEVWLLPRSEKK